MLSLEHSGKISWDNVNFLIEVLSPIKRLDLAKRLTKSEVRRDLTILLHFYARNRLELDQLVNVFPLTKTTARHLMTIFTENENERYRFYAARMRSLAESKKNIHQVFEDDIDVRSGVNSPWSKLTMLVIISGEIIVAA